MATSLNAAKPIPASNATAAKIPTVLTHRSRWVWRWQSKPIRPVLPKDLQALIYRMALENLTLGQERIANELLLELGLRISPRTVRTYVPAPCAGGAGKRDQSQRWSTFMRTHAKGIVAHDFGVAVASGIRIHKTPVRAPVANAICERVIGTMRREGLDFVIPVRAIALGSDPF